MKTDGIVERLEEDVVLGAEGYIFALEKRGYLQAGAYVPEVVLEFPDAVRELHREFLRAGSEVMVACTYYGHREKLRAVGREDDIERMNLEALKLAREIAAEGNALVAGNISNTWCYDPHDHEASAKQLKPIFDEQVRWAVDSGADFIIGETFDHTGEARIALSSIKDAGVPSLITFIAKHEQSSDGYSWAEACKILADEGADIVGLNCGRGPQTMYRLLEAIRSAVTCYVAALPVAYRTTEEQPFFQVLKEPNRDFAFPLDLDPFVHTRGEMAEFAVKARDLGVNYIGVCCGAEAHHLRSMAEALGREVPASKYSPDIGQHPFLGSGKKHTEY
jgi:betaine-homocysteine S-methyltransferase